MKQIAAILILTCLACAEASASVTVELRDTVYVGDGYIRLHDIARVRGLGNDADAAKKLGRIFVGPAPKVGEFREITREQLAKRIREIGFGYKVLFRGADSVVVQALQDQESSPSAKAEKKEIAVLPTPKKTEIPEAKDNASAIAVQKAVAEYLSSLFPGKDVRISISVGRIEGQFGDKGLEVLEVERGTLPGNASIALAEKGSRVTLGEEISAQVEVSVHAPVLVARRNIRKGETLREKDFSIVKYSLKSGEAYLPATITAVDNRAAARSLRAGSPLLLGDLDTPIAIKKGQLVKVDTVSGGFRIRTVARATRDAKVGENIDVENLNPNTSRKTFPATVTGMGEVKAIIF